MRILIVRTGALGDAIHALPLVNALKRLDPTCIIDWAAGGGVRKFLEGHPAVNGFVPVERKLKGILAARAAVKNRYDVAIDAQGLIKSAVIASAAAEKVIGRAPGYARERPATWFYTDLVEPVKEHIIEQNLELLLPIHPEALDPTVTYEIPLPEPPAWPLLASKPILFNIGGGWWTKLWPLHNFARLADLIRDSIGAPVGIVWGPGEEEQAMEIARRCDAIPAPPTTFRELGAVLARARALVSGETGPLHLAAAVGCRTVSLCGPTAAGRNGAYGPGHVAVEPDLPCRPCHARSCADWRCMPAITPDQVLEALGRGLP